MKATRNLLTILFLSLLGFIFHSYSQLTEIEKKGLDLIAKSNLLNLQYPQEKIYLHLDRPSYWASDDIWFKAYLKNSPVKNCNLYVELINSSGFVVYKRICWVQNGLAYGDIHLKETLPGGIYQIRAYTNWMRNFDEEWFFRKDLVIWNLSEKDKIPEDEKIKQNDFDIQFLPEGGTFVAGLQNKMAFKAVNNAGNGVGFIGEIVDESGNKIIDFKSDYNGMGSFDFTPQEGVKYTAKVVSPGEGKRNMKLPVPQNQGQVFSVKSINSDIIQLKVLSNLPGKDTLSYLVVGQSVGEVCFQNKIVINKNNGAFEIEKSKLPGGILKFTLFNSDNLPVCERLVFNNHFEIIDLKITTNKASYVPRDSVVVAVESFTKTGKPCLSNLSMSVYNPANQLRDLKYSNNIISHFLLNSELKGNIENPWYYFKDDSVSTQIDLDNVMLTHGYRYFDWQTILSDEDPEIEYEPESSIEFKGRVVSDIFEKPMEDCRVTMMTVKSQLGVYEDVTDSLGQFIFSDLFFYDTIQVSIQALNKKGKRNTIVQLDRSSITSPEVNFLPSLYEINEEEPVKTMAYLNESQGDLIKRKWNLSDTILLEEIFVTAQARKKDDGLFRIYNEADFVIDMKDEQKLDIGNVFDVIEGKLPGVRREMGGMGEEMFVYRGKSLLIYLDGIPADYNLVKTFPVEAFAKIELIRIGVFAGVNTDRGILFFYTKRGEKFINMPTDKLGMKSAKIVGYSPIRRFYSPRYETTKQPSILDDFRNTIYWNPIVRTDSTGVALVSFYNSDEIGNMQIVVEGITSEGKLCRGLFNYEVKD